MFKDKRRFSWQEDKSAVDVCVVIITSHRIVVNGYASSSHVIGNMTMDLEQDTRVRYRRTKSVSRAEDLQKEEARVRRSQPDKP